MQSNTFSDSSLASIIIEHSDALACQMQFARRSDDVNRLAVLSLLGWEGNVPAVGMLNFSNLLEFLPPSKAVCAAGQLAVQLTSMAFAILILVEGSQCIDGASEEPAAWTVNSRESATLTCLVNDRRIASSTAKLKHNRGGSLQDVQFGDIHIRHLPLGARTSLDGFFLEYTSRVVELSPSSLAQYIASLWAN